jgi:hypothetical protein
MTPADNRSRAFFFMRVGLNGLNIKFVIAAFMAAIHNLIPMEVFMDDRHYGRS